MSDYSTVQCVVAGAEIGARACVDRQVAERCFCPKAPLAIGEVRKVTLPGTRLTDALDTLTSRARAMILKPHKERFQGPALVMLQTGKAPEPQLISPVPLPAPPKQEELLVPKEIPAAAPWATTSRLPELEPPAPRMVHRDHIKEKQMPQEAKFAKCKWNEEACDEQIRIGGPGRANASGLCKKHRHLAWQRKNRDAAPPRKPKAAAKPNGHAAPPLTAPSSAPPADVTQLIEQKLAHHRDQAAHHASEIRKCERALAALRE